MCLCLCASWTVDGEGTPMEWGACGKMSHSTGVAWTPIGMMTVCAGVEPTTLCPGPQHGRGLAHHSRKCLHPTVPGLHISHVVTSPACAFHSSLRHYHSGHCQPHNGGHAVPRLSRPSCGACRPWPCPMSRARPPHPVQRAPPPHVRHRCCASSRQPAGSGEVLRGTFHGGHHHQQRGRDAGDGDTTS